MLGMHYQRRQSMVRSLGRNNTSRDILSQATLWKRNKSWETPPQDRDMAANLTLWQCFFHSNLERHLASANNASESP